MALPISQYQAKIMELLERDDIPAMVIVGETGCGKSTQAEWTAGFFGMERVTYLRIYY